MNPLERVLKDLQAAGAPYIFRNPQTDRRSMQLPWSARTQAAAILTDFPGVAVDPYDGRWETRSEKTVAVPVDGDDRHTVAVTVELDIDPIDVVTAAIAALAEDADGIENVSAYLRTSRTPAPDGTSEEVVRLRELIRERAVIDRAHGWLDDGPFASDYPEAPIGARTAAQLLIADHISAEEIPSMGHVLEALARWSHVIDQGIKLDELEAADAVRAREVRLARGTRAADDATPDVGSPR